MPKSYSFPMSSRFWSSVFVKQCEVGSLSTADALLEVIWSAFRGWGLSRMQALCGHHKPPVGPPYKDCVRLIKEGYPTAN